MRRDVTLSRHIPEQIRTKRAYRTYLELVETGDWLRQQMSTQLANFDLTWTQFRVLDVLYHEGLQYQQELSRRFKTCKQSMEHVLRRLEEAGWVRRDKGHLEKTSENPKAARGRPVICLRLTPEGEKKMADVFPKHSKLVKSYLKALDGREQETLVRLCEKLKDGYAVSFVKEYRWDDPPEHLDWKK